MSAKERQPGRQAPLSKEEKRRARWVARWVARWIVLCAVVIAALAVWVPTWPVWAAPVVLPVESAELISAAEGMDEIRITAEFDPADGTLAAMQTMHVTNRTDSELNELVFRSYSGAYLKEETSPAATDEWHYACYPAGFDAGGLTLQGVRIDGELVLYSWMDDACTVLNLPLETALQPGETAEVELAYTVEIPACAGRFGHDKGIWALGHVFPTLALHQDGAWRMDAVTPVGDPYLSECANWSVHLTLPEGYAVAASVYAESAVADGMQTIVMNGHALRDFALVISDQLTVATAMEGDTMLAAYARTDAQAREMVRYLGQALRSYEKRYGAYAYPTMTAAAVSLPHSAEAFSRMIMVSDHYVQSGGQTLEFSIADDAAHQWWQIMVGSDSWYEPWQHESLAEWALMDYIGDYYGADSRESAIFSQIETAMRITIPRGVTPASPIDYFSGQAEYTQVVSLRGASLWTAMETMLGRETLEQALAEYAAKYRFAMVDRAALTAILESAAGRELDDLLTDYLDTNINN